MEKGIQINIKNPHNWVVTGLISIEKLKLPETLYKKSYQLYTSLNQEITSQISQNADKSINIKFLAENIPKLGSKVYTLKSRDPKAEFLPPEEGLMDGNDYYVENDVFRFILEENGTFTLMQKMESKEESDEEPLIIMGEELGTGSIWAGDDFIKYFDIFQIKIGDHVLKWSKIDSKLVEASDFYGKIHVQHYSDQNSDILYPISTEISVQKGENSLILMNIGLIFRSYSENSRISFQFPMKIKDIDVWNQGNYIYVLNKINNYGIAFIGKEMEILFDSVENSKVTTIQLIPNLLKQSKDKITNKYNIAMIPFHQSEEKNIEELTKLLTQYIDEYLHPLDYDTKLIDVST